MQQHDIDDTMTRKSDQGNAWPKNTPDAQEAEDDIQQQTPKLEKNTQGLGEQMQSSNEATQRYPQRQASTTSKYQFFERQGRQYHAHCQSHLAARMDLFD